jgi:hypothetical protein
MVEIWGQLLSITIICSHIHKSCVCNKLNPLTNSLEVKEQDTLPALYYSAFFGLLPPSIHPWDLREMEIYMGLYQWGNIIDGTWRWYLITTAWVRSFLPRPLALLWPKWPPPHTFVWSETWPITVKNACQGP